VLITSRRDRLRGRTTLVKEPEGGAAVHRLKGRKERIGSVDLHERQSILQLFRKGSVYRPCVEGLECTNLARGKEERRGRRKGEGDTASGGEVEPEDFVIEPFVPGQKEGGEFAIEAGGKGGGVVYPFT